MSIQATCGCGAAFAAKPDLAGKRVRCPSCGQPFTVPQAQRPGSSIKVQCQCGKAFQAKTELAGKRVKCPSCTQPLAIPVATGSGDSSKVGGQTGGGQAVGVDPLGLGRMAHAVDPLAAAGGGFDPSASGSLLPASPMPSMPVAKSASPGSSRASRKSSRQSRRQKLTTAAGYVAMGYGAFQVLLCAYGIINGIILLARAGRFSSIFLGSYVWSFAFLALGGWVAKLGYDIVQGDRDALHRAGQASTIYIGLAILQLVFFMAFGLIALVGLAPTNSLAVVIGLLLAAGFRLILLLPPAFILYVDREYPSKR